MKHIKQFEALGINKDLEEQAKRIYDIIVSKSETNTFSFIYHHLTKGNTIFRVIIDKDDKYLDDRSQGRFSSDYKEGDVEGVWFDVGKYEIYLKVRNDFKVLLHEMKHMDYRMSHPKIDIDEILYNGKRIFNDENISSFEENKGLNSIKSVFYLMNEDEFEAKYHGYYIEIDEFLKEHLPINPSPQYIVDCINIYLKAPDTDKSYTWWSTISDSKLESFMSRENLIKFYQYALRETDNSPYYATSLDDFFKRTRRYFRSLFGKYDTVTDDNIDIIIAQSNKIIAKNTVKFKKKFNRLYSIMVDKYINKKTSINEMANYDFTDRRVILKNMDDKFTNLKRGDKGTIKFTDDMGQIHVKWDNGSTLALIPGVDDYEILDDKVIKNEKLTHKIKRFEGFVLELSNNYVLSKMHEIYDLFINSKFALKYDLNDDFLEIEINYKSDGSDIKMSSEYDCDLTLLTVEYRKVFDNIRGAMDKEDVPMGEEKFTTIEELMEFVTKDMSEDYLGIVENKKEA